MKKRYLLILLILIVMIPINVRALEAPIFILDSCQGLLGDVTSPNSTAYYLDLALRIMRYFGIIALVVLSSLDFIKSIVMQDNDALKKAYTTSIKRLIYCVAIFFVPTLVNFIMQIIGVYGTCGIK